MEKVYVEKAIQLVIMNALENGHTDKNELIAYMQSKEFKAAVTRQVAMLTAAFGS